MHGYVPSSDTEARNADDRSCVNFNVDWFPIVCKQLFESKAGTALHYATGFDERTCQRYASGETKNIPANFLCALLRSDGGYTWLNVVMDGARPQWWRELDAARELTIKYRVERR